MSQATDLPESGTVTDRAITLIGMLSLAPVLGLLAAAQCLPLAWLPCQAAVLGGVVCCLAAALVRMRARLRSLSGQQATGYAWRAHLAALAAVALLVVALPAYRYQRLTTPGGQSFPATIALSVALCALVIVVSGALTRCWSGLHTQPWERRTTPGSTAENAAIEGAGRVDRQALLAELWRWWLGGTLALGAALVLCAYRSAESPAWATPAVTLSLAVTTIAGLALLSEAARLRQTAYWQLEGISVEDSLSKRWAGQGLGLAVAALATVAALLVLRVGDLVAAAEYWVIWSVLVPLARWLMERFGAHGTTGACSSSQCALPPPLRGPSPRLPASHAPAGPPAKSFDWGWLAHDWPVLLGIAALLVLCRAALSSRRQPGGAAVWLRMLRALWHDLRRLLALLLAAKRPLARLLDAIADRAARVPAGTPGRAGGHRASRGARASRQQIIDLYVASLRNAARRGYPRSIGQTAQEYAEALPQRIPATSAPIRELTNLFVAARYGEQPIDPSSVSRMRELRMQLRKALRG